MKISFNEMSLQTMFEYPSESSLAEEDEEEEEEEKFSSEMEDDKPSSFFIPHPNSTLHPNVPNPGELLDLLLVSFYSKVILQKG